MENTLGRTERMVDKKKTHEIRLKIKLLLQFETK